MLLRRVHTLSTLAVNATLEMRGRHMYSALQRPMKDVLAAQGRHLGHHQVRPDDSVAHTLHLMKASSTYTMLVVDNKRSIVGMITHNNLLGAPDDEKDSIEVKDLMKPADKMISLTSNDTILRCMELFANFRTPRMPIIDNDRLVGLLSGMDIIRFLYREIEQVEGNPTTDNKGRYSSNVGLPSDTKLFVLEEQKYFLDTGTANIPHPKKRSSGGEDAHFVWRHPQRGISVFGIADGVGLWSKELGVDPARFSRSLIQCIQEAAQEGFQSFDDSEQVPVSSHDLLKLGWEKLKERANNDPDLVGSSTVCVLMFDGESAEINAANIGDSGFIIVRRHRDVRGSIDMQRGGATNNSSILFQSVQQLKDFNHPYQLGIIEENSTLFESPADADRPRIRVGEGDIIILATDGLFDNLPASEIVKECGKHTNPQTLAQSLSQLAFERSQDADIDSPFALLAKENNIMYSGGIEDDITVIVCVVQKK